MKKRSDVAWLHSLSPPSFSKLYWQCRVYAKPRHFHFHHLSNTRPDPHSTRPRELATDSRGAGPEGPFDQYVTRQTSKPVIMGRTIIRTDDGRRQGGPGTPYDRASPDACTRHDLQARTLSSRRTTPEKFEERRRRKGTASGEEFGTNQGKGTTPGFEGQAGSYIMAQKGTVEAVTSRQSLRDSRPTASLPVPPDSNRCRCLVAATRHVATM